jgi:DNA repair protein RecO (recombination protein O)
MSLIHDEAVVLGRIDYSETSQVLVLFTREHGKVRTIAKGIKRGTKARFAVGVDLLDVGHVVFSSHGERSDTLATLTEWKPSRSLWGLREKLFRIHAGQYAAEVTAHLTEDWDAHADLFDALVSTLVALTDAPEPLDLVTRYQFAILDSIGSLPRFDTCVLCDRKEDLTHFSSFEGGLICRHCEPGQVEKREISAGTVKALGASMVHDDHCSQSSGAPAGVFTVLNYHIAHLMGREPVMGSTLVSRFTQRVVE